MHSYAGLGLGCTVARACEASSRFDFGRLESQGHHQPLGEVLVDIRALVKSLRNGEVDELEDARWFVIRKVNTAKSVVGRNGKDAALHLRISAQPPLIKQNARYGRTSSSGEF
jgi:hypothetical protein